MQAISSCHSLITLTLSLSFCYSGYWFKIRPVTKQNNPNITLQKHKVKVTSFLQKVLRVPQSWNLEVHSNNRTPPEYIQNLYFIYTQKKYIVTPYTSKNWHAPKFIPTICHLLSLKFVAADTIFKIRFLWHIWSMLYKKLKHIGQRCRHIFIT